jgi:hypothetical protein
MTVIIAEMSTSLLTEVSFSDTRGLLFTNGSINFGAFVKDIACGSQRASAIIYLQTLLAHPL